MRIPGLVAAWIATLFFALPAPAWNATGHRVIAAIAYERLTPAARARVDDLIRAHPDYAAFTTGAPEDPAARARWAFIAASVWADNIRGRGETRFYDETNKDAKPTPQLPGFTDMKKHGSWHYYDTPYTPDHAHAVKQAPPNALTELPRLIKEIGKAPQATAAYDLVWIEHMVGDVHQPLHCISRILRSMPEGDAGGNRVFVTPVGNLHGLWDGAPGRDASDAAVTRLASEIVKEHSAPPHIEKPEKNLEKKPKAWIKEGAELARVEVYTFGLETGTREHPIPLPESYVENARRIARVQMATAGYRLAEVLNDRLK
jgi:hypothetical protein